MDNVLRRYTIRSVCKDGIVYCMVRFMDEVAWRGGCGTVRKGRVLVGLGWGLMPVCTHANCWRI